VLKIDTDMKFYSPSPTLPLYQLPVAQRE